MDADLEAVQKYARIAMDEHGPVAEVNLKEAGPVEVLFADGFRDTLIDQLRFGYPGTGSDLFGFWLRCNGFKVTSDDVYQMKPGMVLTRPREVVDQEFRAFQKHKREAKEREEEERRREEEENRRIEESERRRRIMEERGNRRVCLMCGQRLGFMNRLLGRDIHSDCPSFKESVAPRAGPEAANNDRKAGGTAAAMVLFLFNSDNPPADAETSYGTFSETRLLKHLFGTWKQDTGQNIDKTELKACHGDLFETHPLGENACTLRKLGKMMRDDTLDASRLRPEFDGAVRKGKSVGFIPWVVGLFPAPDSVVRSVHDALKAELPEFYLGVVTLPTSCQFEATASHLALPQTMRIRKGQLVGDWQGKAP